ncbi:uncharacterized protein [Coffea arabica]|uniref:MULE transposase domain-containing protein n=1 Tax=Coffea arabica TaxID=13443 RepID=A0A6P6TVJ4_COFAR|nr:uncharacterized protein LOC113704670 [Coffea arabica]
MQLYRAKQKAQDIIDGSHGDSYSLLPKYCVMIMNTNPGSIAKIQFEMTLGSAVPSVKRMFVGLDALKKGFFGGCLPFIGFDGCHLKGPYGGVLLSAIGLDGNNGLYPIAYAIVESENKESWMFFFEWLAAMLDDFRRDRPWTFMTDRQKGLIEAINSKVPWAVNRKCCRHIYSNFRGHFPGVMLRQLFWQASRAYTEVNFKEAMAKIKDLKPAAHEWLEKIPYHLWSRHAFPTDLKNDHITNNIVESFNHWIGDLRGKNVLTLLDNIRSKLMSRLLKRFEKGCLYKNNVVSNVKNRLNVWNLSGIPCKHATAVLINKREDLESYCDFSKTKEFYIRAYNEVIHPIPDVKFWPPIEVNPSKVLPPVFRRKAGRPRKARRREQGEAPTIGQGKRSSTLNGMEPRVSTGTSIPTSTYCPTQESVTLPAGSTQPPIEVSQGESNTRHVALSQTPEEMFGSSRASNLPGKNLAAIVIGRRSVAGNNNGGSILGSIPTSAQPRPTSTLPATSEKNSQSKYAMF